MERRGFGDPGLGAMGGAEQFRARAPKQGGVGWGDDAPPVEKEMETDADCATFWSGGHTSLESMERALCAAGGGEPTLSMETIEAAVVEAFNVSRRDMPGGRPGLRINDYPACVRQARKAAIYLCRKLTDEPPTEIGARFGFAARTVGGVTRTVERLIDSDPAFAACLGGALSLLQAGFGRDDSRPKKLPQS